MLGDNVGAWKRPLLHFTAWRVEMILLILITIIKTLLSEGVACACVHCYSYNLSNGGPRVCMANTQHILLVYIALYVVY
jgi:hypothetical protein